MYGRGYVDLLYVSTSSFDELDQGADYGDFGEFLETIDYSNIPLRVIRIEE